MKVKIIIEVDISGFVVLEKYKVCWMGNIERYLYG